MSSRRKTIVDGDIILKTTDNKKHHHLINKVKNTLVKAPYHTRVKSNYILQIPNTKKFVLFQSYFEEIDPSLQGKEVKRVDNALRSKGFLSILKDKKGNTISDHNKKLNSFLNNKLGDRNDVKVFNDFSELKDRNEILYVIEGLNGSYVYAEPQYEKYFNKVDFSDKYATYTLKAFNRIKAYMINVLEVFNDKRKIKELLINQDTLVPRVSPTKDDVEELESLKGSIESKMRTVYEEQKELQYLNTISNLLPQTIFPKIGLFLQLFKTFEVVDNKRDMVSWLTTNFKVAKAILVEINQSSKNTIQEKTLNKIIKEIQ